MLNVKKVKLDQTEYTATEANLTTSLRLSRFRDEAAAISQTIGEDDRDLTYALFIWPMVAASVAPLVTWAEFINMRDDRALALTSAVMEVNPHWFESEADDPKN